MAYIALTFVYTSTFNLIVKLLAVKLLLAYILVILQNFTLTLFITLGKRL